MFVENAYIKELLTVLDDHVGYPSTHYRGPDHGLDASEGFDCSGFIIYILNRLSFFEKINFDTQLRHANELFDRLGVAVHEPNIAPGDLIFFTREGKAVTHVGFYRGIGNNGKPYMIHSPGISGQKVELKQIKDDYLPFNNEHQLYRKKIAGYKRLTLNDPRSSRWPQRPIW